ncbi:MAG TPA: DNA polymerase III subunit beta [Bacillota bacterium]|nr:DNA polymerase III subunit beta [Bacillota bacterium]
MKFRIEKKALLELLLPASAASTNKNSLPALEGLLFTVEGDTLTICGYDLEKGVRTQGTVYDTQDGAVVINAQRITSIVRNFSDCDVEFSCDERNYVEINGGQAQFKIHGLPADAFPSLPELGNDKSFDISQNILKEMIQSTVFAVAQSDARPILCGELFKIEGTKLTVVALDNFRLAFREESYAVKNNEDFFSVVIPGRALTDLVKVLTDTDETAHVELTKKYVVFSLGNIMLFTRLLEGEYLDYSRVIPSQNKIFVSIETIPFLSSVERASLLVDEKLKTPLRCNFNGNTLMISCSTQYGRVNDLIDTVKQGEDIEIGFNNKYLFEAIRACREDKIRAELSTPLMSMVIKPDKEREDGSFLYLVLPCRLKD